MPVYGIRVCDHRLSEESTMQADYDSTTNAISITISDGRPADRSDEMHPRAIVALPDEHPVEVQVLYPDLGISEPLAAVAERYALDPEALAAAAQSTLAAPDRVISLEVAARSAAWPLPVPRLPRLPR
jgi:hypothetical protein